jgi:hypothetical protein
MSSEGTSPASWRDEEVTRVVDDKGEKYGDLNEPRKVTGSRAPLVCGLWESDFILMVLKSH